MGDDVAELISRCASGDHEGLRGLYDHLAPLGYAVALRILRDPCAAEDAVQDGMLDVWRGAARFDPARGGGRSWVITLVRNRAIDRLRTGRAHRRLAERAHTEAVIAPPVATPLQRLEALREARQVRAALHALPSGQRAALLLSHYEGLSHGDIARRTAEPLGTIKSRVRTAHRRLRALLAA